VLHSTCFSLLIKVGSPFDSGNLWTAARARAIDRLLRHSSCRKTCLCHLPGGFRAASTAAAAHQRRLRCLCPRCRLPLALATAAAALLPLWAARPKPGTAGGLPAARLCYPARQNLACVDAWIRGDCMQWRVCGAAAARAVLPSTRLCVGNHRLEVPQGHRQCGTQRSPRHGCRARLKSKSHVDESIGIGATRHLPNKRHKISSRYTRTPGRSVDW